MTDEELDKLSYRELLLLKERIELVIRAAIRAKLAAKAITSTNTEANPNLDLERERDAWLARRKARS